LNQGKFAAIHLSRLIGLNIMQTVLFTLHDKFRLLLIVTLAISATVFEIFMLKDR